ncbi:MAG: LAGLIDADG family homing endonuclease, partial [Nanoarchaeota archaeon]
ISYDEKFSIILRKLKKTTWKNLAGEIGIPLDSIRCLLDSKQAINFAYLIKILNYSGLGNGEIIKLIPYVKSKGIERKYKIPWCNSREFSRFFGYLIAEGRLPGSSNQIWFTNGDEEIVRDYVRLVKHLFNVNPTINEYKAGCWDVLFYSVPIRQILDKFGMHVGGKTENKELTNLFLKNSSDIELGEFLSGLYSGDGYVGKSSIDIITKSRKLGFNIENILVRLGVLFSSRYKVKIATNTGFSGIYREISVYGVENFLKFRKYVTLIHNSKRERLDNLLSVKSNPNLDVIDVNKLIRTVVKELNIKIKPNKKEFPRVDAYYHNQCLPSRSGINYLIDNLFSIYGESENLLLLKQIANSDIYWDEIIEVE